jgi:hypothetical protein
LAAIAVFVAATAAVLVAWHPHDAVEGVPADEVALGSVDAAVMYHVASGIVDGTWRPQIDRPDYSEPESRYGLGMPLVMVPAVAAGRMVGDPLAWAARVNAVVFGLTVAVVFALARRRGLAAGRAAVAGGLTGATLLFTYGAAAFAASALALVVAVLLLALDALPQRRIAAVWAGAASGFAVLVRTDSLLLIVAVAAVAVAVIRRDTLLLFVVALVPWLMVWGWYNVDRFGSPLQFGYPGETFSHPWLAGVRGLLVSPGRGLLLFVPLVAVAAVAWPAVWRRGRVVAVAAAALLVVRVVFFASWWGWDGGYAFGPRFLVPALPVVALGVIEVVRAGEARPVLLRATVVAAVFSFALALIGVRAPSSWTNRDGASPARPTAGDAFMFGWSAFPTEASRR